MLGVKVPVELGELLKSTVRWGTWSLEMASSFGVSLGNFPPPLTICNYQLKLICESSWNARHTYIMSLSVTNRLNDGFKSKNNLTEQFGKNIVS